MRDKRWKVTRSRMVVEAQEVWAHTAHEALNSARLHCGDYQRTDGGDEDFTYTVRPMPETGGSHG
jgi:hypothetical protein